MAETDELLENFGEFWASGLDELRQERHNSATALFFKAAVALCDRAIFARSGAITRNHEQRFRYLALNFPEVYVVVNRLFQTYTKAYSMRISKEEAEEMQEGVRKVARSFEVKL